MTNPRDSDDSVILDFLGDPKTNLGKAPAWAHHLHDCMHETKREAQRLRHRAANRDMTVDKQFYDVNSKLDLLVSMLGGESDDGAGGRGLIGKVNRDSARISSLEGDRRWFMGALAAMTAAGVIVIATVKAWLLSLIHTAPK